MQQEKEVVVIIGGTAGVGRAIVREFAKRQAVVCVLARDEDRLERARAEIEAFGGTGRVFAVDVSHTSQIKPELVQISSDNGMAPKLFQKCPIRPNFDQSSNMREGDIDNESLRNEFH